MKNLSSGGTSWLKCLAIGSVLLAAGQATALPNAAEVIPAQGGPIRITPIYHASMQIEYRGKVIQVDPFSAGDYSGAKKADIILITDIHADHLDEKAIRSLLGGIHSTCAIYGPSAVASQLKKLVSEPGHAAVTVMEIDKASSRQWGGDEGVKIHLQTVPMYNLVRGPKPGVKFHPKGRGDGYILTLGGKRIYIAGDTEVTPEMKALKNIDVAFVPMNLPFTMTPQEAAAGVKAFKPKTVYPYHYRYPFDKPNSNPQTFAAALKGTGIAVKLRDWYGHPAKGAKK